MEDGLAGAGADVDHHPIVLEPGLPSRLRDELQHSLRFVGWEPPDLAEGVDVALGQHEQVRLGARVDVMDRDEPVGGVDVLALADEPTEEAILRQRGCPPW